VDDLAGSVDAAAAETGFSGVVRVDIGDSVEIVRAYGMANRSSGTPVRVDCQFGIASGAKGLTALTVVSLVETGDLALTTPARSVLGRDLPLVDDAVTVEHLVAHRSGIGDYLDEEADYEVTDHVLAVPVHELATTEQYLPVLESRPAKFAPNEGFSYCNGGYVVLALIAERATGTSFYDLVDQRVCAPAGMSDTAFLRSDELSGRAAVGYLEADGLRTNVLHLPVRGSGDGGIYSTAADIHALWAALFEGRIVSSEWVTQMVRPRSVVPKEHMRYGLGFWLHESKHVAMLEGFDAGVSFRTAHDPARRITYTVLSNTTRGAWPIAQSLDRLLMS
jgi:CubicO group peptidase (beta-lactamase class C family)